MKQILFIFLLCALSQYVAKGQVRPKGSDAKIQQLTEMSEKVPIISLNVNKFKEFVKTPPKDYSFIIMFTAMAPSRRCAICHHVNEEFSIVANSFRFSSSYTNKLYFAIVDFDDGFDIFQMLRLNSAPVIMHFPAKGKPKPADTMDLERTGFHAEAIGKWIHERTDVPIRVFRPPNYSGTIALGMLILLVGGFLYLRRNNLDFLYNKQMWAIAALIFCFAMISGQMWNQIRGPPFLPRNKNGPVYINSGSHGQFILESYIIMILNALVVIGFILMIDAAGGVRDGTTGRFAPVHGESNKRRFKAVVGLVLVCVFFSLLLSVFRGKTQGYPYSFLFK